METQNITLAIPKEILHKARRLAVARHTSLSSMVTQMIIDQVDQEDAYQAACARQLAILDAGLNLGTQGAATWTRAELHER